MATAADSTVVEKVKMGRKDLALAPELKLFFVFLFSKKPNQRQQQAKLKLSMCSEPSFWARYHRWYYSAPVQKYLGQWEIDVHRATTPTRNRMVSCEETEEKQVLHKGTNPHVTSVLSKGRLSVSTLLMDVFPSQLANSV
jgi:hypothetical protein